MNIFFILDLINTHRNSFYDCLQKQDDKNLILKLELITISGRVFTKNQKLDLTKQIVECLILENQDQIKSKSIEAIKALDSLDSEMLLPLINVIKGKSIKFFLFFS